MIIGLNLEQIEMKKSTTRATMENGIPNSYQVQAIPTCVKFPKFDGDDLNWWIFCGNKFFGINQTLEDAKLKITITHLYGRGTTFCKLWDPDWVELPTKIIGQM